MPRLPMKSNFSFTLDMSVKDMFFDRPKVMRAVGANERRFLSHAGGFIRKTSRRSMKRPPAAKLKALTEEERKQFRRRVAIARQYGRKRPRRPRVREGARPGTPPYVHTSDLKKKIFFGLGPDHQSVVIGPVRLNKPGKAPEALEYGGRSTIVTEDDRGRKRKRTVLIKPRPYMRPAHAKAIPRFDEFWKQAVRP